jgi:type II secretory pathway component PulM
MNIVSMWRSRTDGERKALAIGAALLAVVLVFVAWLPLERARSRLDAELPRLRASVAQLQKDAAEVKRLRAAVATVASNPAPLATLAQNPLPRELIGAQVSVADDKHVRIVAADAGFAALLDWLVSAQSTHALHVESARIESRGAPGRVRADISLARS